LFLCFDVVGLLFFVVVVGFLFVVVGLLVVFCTSPFRMDVRMMFFLLGCQMDVYRAYPNIS